VDGTAFSNEARPEFLEDPINLNQRTPESGCIFTIVAMVVGIHFKRAATPAYTLKPDAFATRLQGFALK
jgi:hypothetical protein